MIHSVRFTALAEADIAEVFDWYEAKKPDLGIKFLNRVEEAVQLISSNPAAYACVCG